MDIDTTEWIMKPNNTKSPYPHWCIFLFVKICSWGAQFTHQASGEMASFVDSSLSATAAMARSSCKTRGASVAVHGLPSFAIPRLLDVMLYEAHCMIWHAICLYMMHMLHFLMACWSLKPWNLFGKGGSTDAFWSYKVCQGSSKDDGNGFKMASTRVVLQRTLRKRTMWMWPLLHVETSLKVTFSSAFHQLS